MTRQQRANLKKKRGRHAVFSLFLCVFIFLSGIYITNDVMFQMTSSPGQQNIFSLSYVGQALSNFIHRIPIKSSISDAWNTVSHWIEYLRTLANNLIQ